MKKSSKELQIRNVVEHQRVLEGIKKSTLEILQFFGFTKSNSESANKKRNLLMQEEKKVFHERENVLVEGLAAIRQCKADVKSALAETEKLSNQQAQDISEASLVQINSQDSQVPDSILELIRQLQIIFREIALETPIPKFRDTLTMHENIKIWSGQIEQIRNFTHQLLVATCEFMSEKMNSINNEVREISLQANPRRVASEFNGQIKLTPLAREYSSKPINFFSEYPSKSGSSKARVFLHGFMLLLKFKFLPEEQHAIILLMLILNNSSNKQRYTNSLNTSKPFDLFLETQKTDVLKLSYDNLQ